MSVTRVMWARGPGRGKAWPAAAFILLLTALAAEAVSPGSAGGLRVAAKRGTARLAGVDASSPPLEGPLVVLAVQVTDWRSAEDDFFAAPHEGVTGAELPGARTNAIAALLDSGAATHLAGFSDALSVGLVDPFLTGGDMVVRGAAGTILLDLSIPVGFFAHGMQDRLPDGGPQPSAMRGQGNFAAGVDRESNVLASNAVPSVIGCPFLAMFGAWIRNSAQVEAVFQGRTVRTPSVTFFSDPTDSRLPALAHRVFLELVPSAALTVQYTPALGDLFELEPSTPSAIGLGSLFYTASPVQLTEGTFATSRNMLFDTGAQATIISEVAAAELDIDLRTPEFEVDVQGIGGTITAPGYSLDVIRLPATGGHLVWSNAPVVVLNIKGPDGRTVFGVLGSNLFADRDVVFNGIADTPHLDVSARIRPTLRITALRHAAADALKLEWASDRPLTGPSLQASGAPWGEPPTWTTVATSGPGAKAGSFSVTGLLERQFLRVVSEP